MFVHDGIGACVLCGGLDRSHGVPTEAAAAYRIGGMTAVRALVVESDPEDYPELSHRLRTTAPHPRNRSE